ncbi:hypothetical protein PU629_04510 [Pullulanibacillus sp. KACC 23026]|uniref:hypothetical protein n=1 Tax=Pullulanibacillus sp. KACC 23026 TaxID=3028315 RepID=UPI0023B12513|nr:hypothetical protein [Pullulanibacillus sp. KACC 23026]WEG13635.1 hypothetical protein PU629_04510 [Pullulanibacillus sp. KACC 23026]
MRRKRSDPHIQVGHLTIDLITATSGLFMDGPTNAHQWRAVTKVNTGVRQEGDSNIEEWHSAVWDNDRYDG